jgi:prepilin-type processing-associated H-X9-DG protein
MKCAWNLKQISLALNEYYVDNNHHYPPSLSSLYPQYIPLLAIFHCPSVRAKGMQGDFDEHLCNYRYIYYPDDSARKFDDRMILAFDKGSDHQMEGMNAIFADGHVCFFQRERFIAMLGELAGNEKLSMPTRDALRKTLAEVMAEGPVKGKSP